MDEKPDEESDDYSQLDDIGPFVSYLIWATIGLMALLHPWSVIRGASVLVAVIDVIALIRAALKRVTQGRRT